MARIVFVICCCFMLSGVGCSKTDPLNRQAISGDVKLGGEPLASGSIEFHPPEGQGTMSGGVIENGKYAVPAEQGLSPGSYTVRIFSADEDAEPVAVPGESNKLAVEKIPPEYNVNSEQVVEVSDQNENQFDFDIPM